MDNITWWLDKGYTLTIAKDGEEKPYEATLNLKWYGYGNTPKQAVISVMKHAAFDYPYYAHHKMENGEE